MKKVILFFALLFVAGIAGAQTWSLRQCIEYAMEHNIDVQRKMLQREIEEQNVRIAKFNMLPDLNAGISQSFDFGRSANRENVIVDKNSSSTSLSASSNMPLFSGTRIFHQVKSNQRNLYAAMEDLSQAQSDLELSITSAYLAILLNKELLNVARSQILISTEQVERTEKLFEAGKTPESEVFDAKASLAQDELNVVKHTNTLQLSLLDLAQLLELTNVSQFDIAEPTIDDAALLHFTTLLSADTTFENALTIRPEIKAAEHRLESSKHNLRIYQSYYYPSLSLQAGYSTGYYHTNGMALDPIQQQAFGEQLKYNNREYVGFNLNIPIFNRLQTSGNVKIARLNIEQQTLQLESIKKILLKEIQQAYYNAVAAQHQFHASQKSIAASEEAFRYTEERFNAGRATNFDFNNAKTRLIQSQSNLLQAKYDYLIRCKILDFYNGTLIDF